jgi:hypothetical protein
MDSGNFLHVQFSLGETVKDCAMYTLSLILEQLVICESPAAKNFNLMINLWHFPSLWVIP